MANALRTSVIGGGIIGCAVAWRLSQRGIPVTLFERGKIGREASWAAAGMLSPGGEIDERSGEAELLIESRRMYRKFVDDLSTASSAAIDYKECGAIDLAYSEAEWNALLDRQRHHTKLGIRSRSITPAQIGIFSPHASADGLEGALFYPEDGIVAPRDLMAALDAALRAAGVEIREETNVDRIAVQAGGVVIHGERFEQAVVAAGAWSESIEVDGVPPLPGVRPVRGHLLGYDLQLGACPTIIRSGRLYVFQRGTGAIIAGASMENAGFDRGVDANVVADLRARLARMMPIFERLEPVAAWTGFRPASDRVYVGRWQQTPLLLAYGHFRNGILLAPVTAQRIADEVTASAECAASRH